MGPGRTQLIALLIGVNRGVDNKLWHFCTRKHIVQCSPCNRRSLMPPIEAQCGRDNKVTVLMADPRPP